MSAAHCVLQHSCIEHGIVGVVDLIVKRSRRCWSGAIWGRWSRSYVYARLEAGREDTRNRRVQGWTAQNDVDPRQGRLWPAGRRLAGTLGELALFQQRRARHSRATLFQSRYPRGQERVSRAVRTRNRSSPGSSVSHTDLSACRTLAGRLVQLSARSRPTHAITSAALCAATRIFASTSAP